MKETIEGKVNWRFDHWVVHTETTYDKLDQLLQEFESKQVRITIEELE